MDYNYIYSIALKYAVKNAYDYGSASEKAVMGKIFAENPELRKDIQSVARAVGEACKKANSMTQNERTAFLSNVTFIEKKRDDERELMLPQSDKFEKIVTRFPPEPNGYLHLGHAKAAFLGYVSAKNHSGTFVVRFDDTNPEKEKQEYVDAILEDLNWLGITDYLLYYSSDYIDYIYGEIEKLIMLDKAYVCQCENNKINELRSKGLGCSCRERNTNENLVLWRAMIKREFKRGEAILRLKAHMNSPNTAMRDPTLARIVDHTHYRQGNKYYVWPTYDLQAPLMDHYNGVTHAIRSKEYELRDECYYYILESLGYAKPTIVSISRLEIPGYPLSKRILQKLIEEKRLWGFDDPRLLTLKALRRRGIMPEAIKEFVLQFGFSKVNSIAEIDKLYAENVKLLNDQTIRLFMVTNPVELYVENLEDSTKEISLHPTNNLGKRVVSYSKNLYISKTDAIQLEQGEILRLKDLCSIEIMKISENGITARVVETEEMPKKKIQWVSNKSNLQIEILEPLPPLKSNEEFNPESLIVHQGVAENYVRNLKPRDIVQFERFGYCTLDTISNSKMNFIFLHK